MSKSAVSLSNRVEPLYIIAAAVGLYKKYFWESLLFGLLVVLSSLSIEFLPSYIQNAAFLVIYIIIYIILSIIFLWYIDKGEHGSKISLYNASEQAAGKLFRVVFVDVLTMLIFIAGIILLIVPGIFWSVIYSQAGMYALFKNKRIFESLSLSRKLTKGNRFNIFILQVLTIIPSLIVPVLLQEISGTALYYVFNNVVTLISTAFMTFVGYLIWVSLQKIHKENKELTGD